MKSYEIIAENFATFFREYGNDSYKMLKNFFEAERNKFSKERIAELVKTGISNEEAVIKARQGWVSTIGRSLEIIIEKLIKNFCEKNNLKLTNDKVLKSKNLPKELDLVKRAILVHFGKNSVLPDGDIIIYKYRNEIPKVLAILSVKNSFRERYTETPYWKLKLAESEVTKNICVFMITPDSDDEISRKDATKSRIVLEYELDGVYMAKDDFDESEKVKGIEYLISDLEKLL
ncbi:MAG: hypothetical protein J6I73_04680 [Treponema sp.]|nr:hypothetical protein [Treponema sp.]